MKLESLHKDKTYHIYNKGINGETIFINDENKKYFLKLLDKYISKNGSIYAYCLMNNHFHLILHVLSEENVITQSLSNLFNAYAKAFNKANNRTGSLFEKHFRRIEIINDEYLRHLVVYVHLNPLHHFNLDYTAYRFSSYQAYLTDKSTKLQKEDVLTLFNDIDNFETVHKLRTCYLAEKYAFE